MRLRRRRTPSQGRAGDRAANFEAAGPILLVTPRVKIGMNCAKIYHGPHLATDFQAGPTQSGQ